MSEQQKAYVFREGPECRASLTCRQFPDIKHGDVEEISNDELREMRDRPTAKQIIETLEQYHESMAAEADACDIPESSEWHESVARWLRDRALDAIRAVKEERK